MQHYRSYEIDALFFRCFRMEIRNISKDLKLFKSRHVVTTMKKTRIMCKNLIKLKTHPVINDI